jgi:hypothetical protein
MMTRLAKAIGLMLIAGGCTDDQKGPSTCFEAKDAYHVNADGPQTLYVDGDKSMPWSAYCVGMTSDEPIEFIELAPYSQTGEGANYSEFSEPTGPGAGEGSGNTPNFKVRTQYQRVRIDPATLTIDVTNKAFARSTVEPTGADHVSVALAQAVGFMPFGVAMQCGSILLLDNAGVLKPESASANIDLTNLPFELDDKVFCDEVGLSRALPDPSTPSKIVKFDARGETSVSALTCGRASVRCLPKPTVNGQVSGEKTIQLRYAKLAPGFGFN